MVRLSMYTDRLYNCIIVYYASILRRARAHIQVLSCILGALTAVTLPHLLRRNRSINLIRTILDVGIA